LKMINRTARRPSLPLIDEHQRKRPVSGGQLGDLFCGEAVSSIRPTLTVRSEIGPYRPPSLRCLVLLKTDERDSAPEPAQR